MFEGISVTRTVFVLFNFCVVSLYSEFPTNSRWKEYASLCPYTNFCTTNATKYQTTDEQHLRPCCQQCSCEPDCHRYGVCCPDVQHKSHADVDYPCVDLVNDLNRPRGITVLGAFDVNFHIVDRCPNSTIASQYEACLTRSTLRDYIVVTDLTNGRVYRNSHCADCNGVEQYTQWDIYTECQDMNEVFFETFEERDSYILDHCSIIPVPPDALKSSIYRCQSAYFTVIEKCGISVVADKDTRAACEQDMPGTNVMFSGLKQWSQTFDYFKNIYCYQCWEHPIDHAHADLCPLHPFTDIGSKQSRPYVNLMMLLSDQEVSEPTTGRPRCNMSSVWDHYSDSCLKLSCPAASIPYHGKCMSAISASTGVAFTMAFSLDVQQQLSMTDSLSILDEGVSAVFGTRCGRCSTRISRGSTNSSNVYLFFSLYTKMKCNRNFLLRRVARVFERPITITVPDVMYPTVVTLAPNTNIQEEASVIAYDRTKPFCPLSQPITTYILENCARVDTRMIPLNAEIEASPELTEKMINHTVCVHDYFTYMESLYTNRGSNQNVITWCYLWLVLWFLKYIF